MSEGAKFYGVKQEYVDSLVNHEQQPRKKLEEMNSYELPENAPVMSWEDFQKGNGEDGAPIYMALNHKVLEYSGTKEG